ncbi:hypothetical protein SAMN05216480_101714 [Pustulibacterium marinum]|uniref:Uncharacterized protein n=1 Tax=Pustulibacterium marinum TaxID=1224947 RepID=A0A1I7F7L2_9FLAO|nr:hypothetical protein [Pustulibacterium marinum]SFU32182.1 hypothetical protein SAMN05216480_101714 [Pustulibacterium marinum]
MFYLRLNKLKILNNREFIGKAEVKLISFVTLGDSDFPEITDYLATNDVDEKKEILKSSVSKIVSSRVMPEIQKVKDNQVIYFGDTGYNLFVSETIPQDLNWMLLAIESDGKTRETTQIIDSILTDEKITDIVEKFNDITKVSGATASMVTALTSIVADTLIALFKEDKDDQIGLLLTSFIKQQHYPNGKRDKENIPDATGNMFTDYTIFGFE